ncbi:MAG: HAMP domain-containing histidine kinase [Bacteroidales bacterium]|jgi:nitrogen fixation/metabolism regulation signal transduction histidine kinase|nr:HAMP domain-containing histidine kinase [Bacteroidales bacterium]
MQSVHNQLNNFLIFEKTTNPNWTEDNDDLVEPLMALRSTFFTDINLFDVHGELIATSLPDIFDKGLISTQINPDAFIKLTFSQKASIIEKEDIGKLSYTSVYEPIVDGKNNVIAFLNLPYFTQQDDLREEISSVVLAVTNFYMVIILLTVIISIVVSNQITQPLNMLQEKFRNIKLGEKNEPIRYNKNDEIGGLVKEYNRAIEELARSASRLARSERESAWREMAKQIAHEINNPLTPMKLSIQHLKRAWDNKSERFDEYMEKISHSLVEQIDALSFIATEFSNFAKMPVAQNQLIDLITRIDDVVPLFATGDNKRAFHTNYHGLQNATIYADREQISRVFINLFKNALQAIPKDRPADIHVDVLKLNQMIWVRIKDNGMGIPEEMQEKIFRPNFTTKSSGMGVGLTIVRNIIESAGGTISFRTKQNEGTTFIISFPSAETDA